jgi:hypothetical protein
MKEYPTLQSVEDELKRRGIKDVKFCFDPEVRQLPKSQVMEAARQFLSDYLNGQYTVLPFIGDSKES